MSESSDLSQIIHIHYGEDGIWIWTNFPGNSAVKSQADKCDSKFFFCFSSLKSYVCELVLLSSKNKP